MFKAVRSLFGVPPTPGAAKPNAKPNAAAADAAADAALQYPLQTPRRRQAPRTPPRSAYDLDVTAILPQLYCMGQPWMHRTNKEGHKNNIDEVVAFLESRFENHYLIFNLTGNTLEADCQKYTESGSNGLLPKPTKLVDLQNALTGLESSMRQLGSGEEAGRTKTRKVTNSLLGVIGETAAVHIEIWQRSMR